MRFFSNNSTILTRLLVDPSAYRYHFAKNGNIYMRTTILSVVAAFSLAACASSQSDVSQGTMADPYEDFNRSVFAFNMGLDKYAIEPTAKAYGAITPSFLRDRFSDFARNLGEPVTFVNSVLQGEGTRAGDTAFRFVFNSTVGLLGVWDPAEKVGVTHHDEDFGQTLAVWGVPSGPYLVLPLLGSSNPRDALGLVVDRAFQPLTWIEFESDDDLDTYIMVGSAALAGLNTRLELDEQIKALNSQPEPYIALKRVYTSQRESAILNGKVDEENVYDDLPDFDEFEY